MVTIFNAIHFLKIRLLCDVHFYTQIEPAFCHVYSQFLNSEFWLEVSNVGLHFLPRWPIICRDCESGSDVKVFYKVDKEHFLGKFTVVT
jgi:hypothetical protein